MLPILLCIILSTIIYQDFRYRAVSIYWLCWILVLAVVNSVVITGWLNTITNAGINLALLAVQIAGVMLYFSLKHKKFTNIINQQLGSGDLLFYVSVAFSFSPVNFIIFSIGVYVIILVVFLVLKVFLDYRKSIPLAGCLAFFMMIVIVLNVLHIFEAFNDDLLIRVTDGLRVIK
jgi:hypothetical protein